MINVVGLIRSLENDWDSKMLTCSIISESTVDGNVEILPIKPKDMVMLTLDGNFNNKWMNSERG